MNSIVVIIVIVVVVTTSAIAIAIAIAIAATSTTVAAIRAIVLIAAATHATRSIIARIVLIAAAAHATGSTIVTIVPIITAGDAPAASRGFIGSATAVASIFVAANDEAPTIIGTLTSLDRRDDPAEKVADGVERRRDRIPSSCRGHDRDLLVRFESRSRWAEHGKFDCRGPDGLE